MFDNCCCVVHTSQLEFANFSLSYEGYLRSESVKIHGKQQVSTVPFLPGIRANLWNNPRVLARFSEVLKEFEHENSFLKQPATKMMVF